MALILLEYMVLLLMADVVDCEGVDISEDDVETVLLLSA